MKKISLFKYIIKDTKQDDGFAKHFRNELLQSELLRSNILIGVFSLFILGIFIPPFFGYKIIWSYPRNDRLIILFLCFYFGAILYELLIRMLVRKAIESGKQLSNKIRYGNALEEASIPTIGILISSRFSDPIEVLLGPGSFLYFIFILLGALRLEFGLSVFTGVVSAIEYFVLSQYYLSHVVPTAELSAFLVTSIYPKCFILLFAGIITGIVTLEIKRRIHHSFRSMEEQNRLLDRKVNERTRELQDLNRNLQKTVDREIHKSREKEQLLVQQSKMSAMGEMIGMIAHQWRQPLASIGVTVSDLQIRHELDQLDNASFNQAVEGINYQTQYLSNTITDFRKFLSPTKKLETTCFNDVLENSLRIIGKSMENKNIKVTKDYSFNRELVTYPNELMQVVINVLKNAVDACLDNEITDPSIVMEGREESDRLYFSITDNAGGIPDELKDRIFDPYFTTKSHKDGTGLGLYMSKTIVEKHCSGKLSVANTTSGASFRIELPYDP